ncbi:MAG: helix-turn-helix transcriptional regulator [Ruminococcaceae bacterium]|nr:helix-turn-helix transcriptional regulator [Oscillospiraceae bacterium]
MGMKSIIAQNVKSIIKARGYKQSAVAKMAGINEKTFSNMMTGRKVITDYDVSKIIKALGVTPNEIFGYVVDDRRSA